MNCAESGFKGQHNHQPFDLSPAAIHYVITGISAGRRAFCRLKTGGIAELGKQSFCLGNIAAFDIKRQVHGECAFHFPKVIQAGWGATRLQARL